MRIFDGLTAIGVLMLFGTLIWFTMITVNATFDRSQATERPVVLMEREVTLQFKGLLQQHKVAYSFVDDESASRHNRVAAPAEYVALSGTSRGQAHVKAGFFGWPWIGQLGPPEGP